MTNIRAVFFDLGKTLIYPKNDWLTILRQSEEALIKTLIENGVEIDSKRFRVIFVERLNKYYADREITLREDTTYKMFAELLQEEGFNDVPDTVIRKALAAKYTVTQSNWHLEEDARSTLQALKAKGYAISLVSNAGDDPDVQILLDKHNIRQYFSHIFTSAASSYRKPHPTIFESAMTANGVTPAECVMVGDTLNADIKGANALGIYSIWIDRRVKKDPKELETIHPKAIISTLAELPELLDNL